MTLFARKAYKQGILDVKFLSNLSKKCKVIKNHNMSINLITQTEFEALYNERRRQQMKDGFFKKSWPLITTKVIKKRQDIYKADENGVPTLVERIPGVSKKAFNTNNFNALCQAVWQ